MKVLARAEMFPSRPLGRVSVPDRICDAARRASQTPIGDANPMGYSLPNRLRRIWNMLMKASRSEAAPKALYFAIIA